MSDISNKEFNDLLVTLAVRDTFEVQLTDGNTYKFTQLSTDQLKELIKTVVDSPLTQSAFNTTLTKIMAESLADKGLGTPLFNVVDRLIFCLTTRIESLSPNLTVTPEGKPSYVVNLSDVKQKLLDAVQANPSIFLPQNTGTGNNQIQLTYSIPTVDVEAQLNNELYKNTDINVNTPEELRKVLGEAFINEIAKTINTITLDGDKVLNLSSGSFKSRLKTVESLPASLVQSVIEFVEKYKKVTEGCLVVDESFSVPVDGSLFSTR